MDAATEAAKDRSGEGGAGGTPLVQLGAGGRRKPALVRAKPERWTRMRRVVQGAFLALNLWIGVEFWLFVRHFETGGAWPRVTRPPGVEGWLPIAALLNLKAWVLTGEVPRLFPAGAILLATFIGLAFAFRKAFCSWLCPIGTVSEGLWKLGRRVLGENLELPRWLDVGLRALKYLLLGAFLWVAATMSVEAIHGFQRSPFALIADVKMLDFFRRMTMFTAIALAALVVLSVLIRNFWCRYLCPYGALLGLASILSPTRIRRDEKACIDCGKCARVCPSRLPVDVKRSISSPECNACATCVEACPVAGALELSTVRGRRISPWAFAGGMAAILLGVVLAARITGHWHTPIPDAMYQRLIPDAQRIGH